MNRVPAHLEVGVVTAEVRAVRDLVADDTRALSPHQRELLAELLDGVASGLRVVARIAERHQDEPATRRAAQAISWEQVAVDYGRLLAQWSSAEPPRLSVEHIVGQLRGLLPGHDKGERGDE